MVIKVCDALCGSGKTSAFIRMMNERTDKRFIFVTEFLSEVDRIMSACASRGFVTPDNNGKRKIDSINELILAGENIATTHALFVNCTDDIREKIREYGYVLILDETFDMCRPYSISKSDQRILLESKAMKQDDDCGAMVWLDEKYDAADPLSVFSGAVLLSRSMNLYQNKGNLFYWMIPPDLFQCFDEVYVLTYLFEHSSLRCFMDLYGIDREYVGVKKDEVGYVICPPEEMERKRDLRRLIHIVNHEKCNDIGSSKTALSLAWYSNKSQEVREERHNSLRKALINIERNVFKCKQEDFMWTTFKAYYDSLKDKGLYKSFVPFNKRACNDYANKHYLAYCINNFPRTLEYGFYASKNVILNSDMYALSILVQWVFRSAIRKGEEIWVYIPSKRMRWLLMQWIKNLCEGNDLKEIRYIDERRKKHYCD